MKQDDYIDSFKVALCFLAGSALFPRDEEFRNHLRTKDLYNIQAKNKKFWLKKLENYDRKEKVNIEEYTIEHIMPQNLNLSNVWKIELGDNWKEIQEKYLHTLGNLTLTAYNPELSDRSFNDKKSMKGGFDESPLRLNQSLQEVSAWNETAIMERAKKLSDIMLNIWTYPSITDEVLQEYRSFRENKNQKYTIDHYQFLQFGAMRYLFEKLRDRILNIDTSVREEYLKLYIAYKDVTNFVDVIPQQNQLKLSLNMEYADILDLKIFVKM